MRLLLDTHVLPRAAVWLQKLPVEARALIEVVFSAVNMCGIAIERRLERPDVVGEATVVRRALLEAGYSELPVTGDHAIATSMVPPIHGDPFDRLLIAQATVEGSLLLTADALVLRYPGPIQRV